MLNDLAVGKDVDFSGFLGGSAPDMRDREGRVEDASFALASARERSDSGGDVLDLVGILSSSHQFQLALQDYRRGLGGPLEVGLPIEDGDDFELRLLCARCFIAGEESARLRK